MFSKNILGAVAMLNGIFIVTTVLVNWDSRLYYLWAVLSFILGIIVLVNHNNGNHNMNV